MAIQEPDPYHRESASDEAKKAETYYEQSYEVQTSPKESAASRENILAGIVGAFLFSLVGVALWFILYQLGFIAGISGLVTLVCAVQGYSVFGKAKNKRALVTASVITVIMILVAEYLCLSYDVYRAFYEDYQITFLDAVASAYLYLSEPDILRPLAVDLLIGYVLSGFGCISYIRNFGKTPVK